MSSRITVGLNRKVGQPNYGSLGASCHVDLDVDAASILNGGDELVARIRKTFGLCRQEVERELSASESGDRQRSDSSASGTSVAPAQTRQSEPTAASSASPQKSKARSATEAQVPHDPSHRSKGQRGPGQ